MTLLKFMPALVAVAAAANFQIGVISDPHYNPYYDPIALVDDNCILVSSSVSDDFAPIGRYGCDMGPEMFDLMLTRFSDVFGSIDVLLVPGDHVAHKISSKDEDEDGSSYIAVKENLQATWAKLTAQFPNTVILPTIGNNDGRFHDQAIDEADSADYYSFLYDLWFAQFPGNQGLNLANIKETFMTAGFYRADLTSELTVLQMNSMYWAFDDVTEHDGEQTTSLTWLNSQLKLARSEGRKVIILDHIYAGGRYEEQQLWDTTENNQYFEMLRNYHDVVVIEVGGHDHFADLRFHLSKNVAGLDDTSDPEFYFHNLFVAPGATTYGNSNPGVSKFELSETLVP